MIWLTWRQFRAQTVAAAGLLAVLAIAFAVTGPQLAHLYDTTVATCHAQHDCQTAINAFQSEDSFLQSLVRLVMLAAPALIGIFWGAPLIAHELEAGTQRLAWTQSVTRLRWLAVKLGLAGLASMAAAGLLSLMVTWWSGPFDRIGAGRMDPSIFSERGIVPVGYAAFAFALGVTAGLLIRRTVPAMAVTLAVFAAVVSGFALRVRFHLLPPVRLVSALNMSWVTQTGIGGPAGSKPRRFTYSCPSRNRSATWWAKCTARVVLPTPAVPSMVTMVTAALASAASASGRKCSIVSRPPARPTTTSASSVATKTPTTPSLTTFFSVCRG